MTWAMDGWQWCLNDDQCHGIYDPEGSWAACVYHAHRYGTGRMVTLAQIREALS